MDVWQQVGQVIGALGGTLLLVLVLAYVAKRMQQGSATKTNHLKVVETLHLGTKERVLLVQAGTQQVLLGVTPQQITQLAEVSCSVESEPTEASFLPVVQEAPVAHDAKDNAQAAQFTGAV